MPRLEVAGRSIHYLDRGEGAPVVLLHSGGLSSRQWARLVPRFAGYRVIAPDLLGSGRSDPVSHDHDFHFHEDVAILEALLDTLEEPAHLVGHSYGGLVALTSARLRPERARSLGLFEPVAFGVLYSHGDREAIADLEDYDHDGTFFDDRTGGGEAWMERFIDWWQGRGAWQSLPERSRASFLEVGRKVFQEVRSLTADRTPHDAYAALSMPVLLMSGERSPLAARRVCSILARSLPRAELVSIPDGGHMAPLTHGQLFGELVTRHVERSTPTSSIADTTRDL